MVSWQWVEERSQTAFLVAGGLLTIFSTLVALEVFGGVQAPQALVAIPGLIAAFIGLLGFYPRLSDESSLLAPVGLAVLVIAGVGLLGVLFWVVGLTAAYGVDAVKPPSEVILLSILLTILGYVLFGVAAVRQAVPNRKVGYLLLAPPGTLALMVASGILYGGNPPGWTSFVFSAMQAVAHLAIGYGLRGEERSFEHPDMAGETAARR